MVAWLWVKCEIILYPQLYCIMGYQWYDMVYILSLSRDMVFMVLYHIFYLLERYPSETDQPGTGGGPILTMMTFATTNAKKKTGTNLSDRGACRPESDAQQ